MSIVLNGTTGITTPDIDSTTYGGVFSEDGTYLRLASGTGGIQFGGDTADANALDDYEEGTWTPVVADAATGGNESPGVFQGAYVKIGRLVYITLNCSNIDTTGLTGGNTVYFRNLPFTSSGTGTFYMGSVTGRVTCNGKYLTPRILSPTTYLFIDDNPGTTVNPSQTTVSAIVDDGGDVRISASYISE
jgi:hypothetical protein